MRWTVRGKLREFYMESLTIGLLALRILSNAQYVTYIKKRIIIRKAEIRTSRSFISIRIGRVMYVGSLISQ